MNMKKTHSSLVFDYLKHHRGVDVHYSDIATATGLSTSQVFTGVAHLRRTGHTINSGLKGWYTYVSPPNGKHDTPVDVTAPAIIVSALNDGRVLLTIDGRLFVAVELDIEV